MRRGARRDRRPGNRVRIIGGDWRGRRLPFPDAPGLRPSSDRLRETLFNWLQLWTPGARCLDLFAGSGAIGFEAASRGARLVDMVEKSPPVYAALVESARALGASGRVRLVHADALEYLRRPGQPYELVFLDPPFDLDLLQPAIAAIERGELLSGTARVYVESPRAASLPPLPGHWVLDREAGYGDVAGRLYRVER